MVKNKILKIEDLSKDAQALYDVLNEESDLACVLIGTSYLDQTLASILERFFIESNDVQRILDPISGILGTFASRFKICYCLGLISECLYLNLKTIAKIRNKFAHEHLMLSFDDDEVIKLVNSLTFPPACEIVVEQGHARDNPEPFLQFANNPRSRFTIILVLMVNQLLLIGLATQHRTSI